MTSHIFPSFPPLLFPYNSPVCSAFGLARCHAKRDCPLEKRAAFTAYQALARKKMFANATPKLVQSAKESQQKGFFVFLVQ